MILAGCAQQPATKAEAWLTPEPLQVPYRNELAIARLSEILQRAELTEAQSAQLFYDRGVMYDSVGLRSLARLDFMRAGIAGNAHRRAVVIAYRFAHRLADVVTRVRHTIARHVSVRIGARGYFPNFYHTRPD